MELRAVAHYTRGEGRGDLSTRWAPARPPADRLATKKLVYALVYILFVD